MAGALAHLRLSYWSRHIDFSIWLPAYGCGYSKLRNVQKS
jgi:hypothetical protein